MISIDTLPEDGINISPLEIQGGTSLDDANQSSNLDTVKSKDNSDIRAIEMMGNISPNCWFLVGFYLAVFCIASLMSHAPKKMDGFPDAAKGTIDNEDLLQLAENVTKTCSASKIKTEKGRGECQEICLGHSCCFTNDETSSYTCNDDPDMLCSVYVGCELLFMSAEDLNGVTNGSQEAVLDMEEASNLPTQQYNQSGFSDLQLVSHAISTVCASDNLHAHHSLQECADLCHSSMCCFDKNEIKTLNPQFETVLKLEGITDTMLDLSSTGKCVDEYEFCLAQSGCKNLFLVGSSRSNPSLQSNRQTNEQQDTVLRIIMLFGIVISLAAYLLISRRLPSLQSNVSRTEKDSLVKNVHSDFKEIS